MPQEPQRKRTIAFIDGQNLFYAVKHAFGYRHPNYDVLALAKILCSTRSWDLTETFFYTGRPSADDNPFWHHFWTAKLAAMGRQGVHTFSRPLKYRNQTVRLASGGVTTVLVGQEKGIDIRLALDVVHLGREDRYDAALIFSQDQDLSEAVDEVRHISTSQQRWIKVACAFPTSPAYSNRRGIHGAEWIRFDRATYDACIDPRDYRPRSGSRR